MPSLVKEGRKNNFNRLLTFIIRFGLVKNIDGFDRRINLCSMASDCGYLLNRIKYINSFDISSVLHELEHYRREDGGHKRSNEPCAVTGFHQSIISEFPNDKIPIERTFDNCFIETFKIALENDFISKWVTEIVRLKPLIIQKMTLHRPF